MVNVLLWKSKPNTKKCSFESVVQEIAEIWTEICLELGYVSVCIFYQAGREDGVDKQ